MKGFRGPGPLTDKEVLTLRAMLIKPLERMDHGWQSHDGKRISWIACFHLRDMGLATISREPYSFSVDRETRFWPGKVRITAKAIQALKVIDATQCPACKVMAPMPRGCDSVPRGQCPFRPKQQKRIRHRTKSERPNRPWIETDLEYMQRHYPHTDTAMLVKHLGRSLATIHNRARQLGLTKTAEYKSALGRERAADPRNMRGRFKPGARPWQRGRSMPIVGRMRETMFRPGHHPPCKKAIGAYGIAKGVLEQKVADTGRRCIDWVPVYRLVWIETHGRIPANHVVKLKDGCSTTDLASITLDRIECVSRKEIMARCQPEARYPDELVQVIRLTTAIKRRLNRMEKQREEQDRGSPQSPVRDTRGAEEQGGADGARTRLRRGGGGERDHRHRQGRGPLPRAHR